MSTPAHQASSRLRRLLAVARVRHALHWLLLLLPLWLGVSALALRLLPRNLTAVLMASAASALVLALFAVAGRFDRVWLARRLDQQPAFEDSAALLFADSAKLSSLAQLQQARLQERVLAAERLQVDTPWRWRPLLFAWSMGLLLFGVAKFGLVREQVDTATPAPPGRPARQGATVELTELRLTITPPSYTGLPERSQAEADARVPEQSRLHWNLDLQPEPESASLAFHDGTRLPLTLDNGRWTGARGIERSSLYRLEIQSRPPLKRDLLRRIEVIVDQPPRIQVRVPELSLSIAEPGQMRWTLEYDATDDYGLGRAQLQIRHATGSGESISISERSEALSGSGDARSRRYARTLDLATFGFAQGDDLIVRLSVSDRRQPIAQTALSANYILRWPDPPASEAAGVDGLVEKVLPAYFRSQRQIIIDSEALLAERTKLRPEKFAERSDLIGVDQRVLRLRYGQFLGEEADEGPGADGDHHEGPEASAHSADPSKLKASTHSADPSKLKASAHSTDPQEAQALGSAAAILEQFGHTHDDAEAATLLDAETRKLLKAALGEMWQAELHLRQANPREALPFEYRALGYIKQVQQASRIYLARVGLELPPVDSSRRLSGDATGLRSRADPAQAAKLADAAPANLWRALEADPAKDLADALDDAQRWASEHERELPDALGLLAALDALRRDRECAECKAGLRRLLWPLLPMPPASTHLREAIDARGRAYLRALVPAKEQPRDARPSKGGTP